jgi:choline kinase
VIYDTAWLELWQRRSDSPLDDAESFSIDGSGRILDIGRRVDSVEEIMGQYLGLLKVEPSAMRWIVELVDKNPDARNTLDMTALLSRLLGEGRSIYGVPIKGGWCEVDNESDLEVAESLVQEGKLHLT